MPERYFAQRPTALTVLEWTGSNLEEVRDFWEARGYDRYSFDVDVDGNLVNPSGTPLVPGTFTIPMGGFGHSDEATILEGMQEVVNPAGMRYSIVEVEES